MRSTNIKWIIGLMAIAVVGLIIIQFYWVNNALTLQEQLFDRSVNKALQAAVQHLEKQNAMILISDRFVKKGMPGKGGVESYTIEINSNTEAKAYAFFDSTDEVDVKVLGFPDTSLVETQMVFAVGDSMKNVEIEIGEDGRKVIRQHQQLSTDKEAFRRVFIENQEMFARKRELINNLVTDLLLSEAEGKDRFTTDELMPVLKDEMHHQGIDIDFELALQHGDHEDQYILVTDGFPKNKDTKIHQAALYPSNLFDRNPPVLSVHFPGQQSYMLKSIWLMLLTSILLLLGVIFGFTFTVQTIYRQKKLSEMKTDFINNMTHELKTPIASISLAAEALQDNSIARDEAASQRFLKVITKENKRLEGHVENVLQMAKLDKGDLKLKKAPINVHDLIEKALDSLILQIERKKGKVQFLPQATQPSIEGDPTHITNIIYNLLDNANKYSREAPDIKVATRDRQDGVVLSVEDKGIGMDKATQKRIFERFYRVPTGNIHDAKGFGLGLSYVKTIVDAHGGSISVNSEPGKGSRFEIFLPHGK